MIDLLFFKNIILKKTNVVKSLFLTFIIYEYLAYSHKVNVNIKEHTAVVWVGNSYSLQ